MTFAEFQRAVRDDALPGVMLFHGEESFLARVGVRLLRKALVAPGSEAFDLSTFSGREATAEAVISHASTAPMLSARRLVVVYEVDRMSPSERTKLARSLDAVPEGVCLALVSYGRLSGRAAWERRLLDGAAVVDCGRPSREVLAGLVARMAEDRGRAIDEPAASLLIDWTESDLSRISNELDKLAAYAEPDRPITQQDIESVVGERASDFRDLAEAVGRRDLGRSLGLAGELVRGGMAPAQLVSQLYAFWISLWETRAGGGGRSRAGVRNMRALAAERTSRDYARGVRSFLEADVGIRKGLEGEALLDVLVYELVKGPKAGVGSTS
ncbi:MAG: DNA polymerase III subunit delta [Candidatus Eisenbacteria bacterium]|nr:DNA polymerase III subunit delta [Candidatus Eisenbacteria bacterium]